MNGSKHEPVHLELTSLCMSPLAAAPLGCQPCSKAVADRKDRLWGLAMAAGGCCSETHSFAGCFSHPWCVWTHAWRDWPFVPARSGAAPVVHYGACPLRAVCEASHDVADFLTWLAATMAGLDALCQPCKCCVAALRPGVCARDGGRAGPAVPALPAAPCCRAQLTCGPTAWPARCAAHLARHSFSVPVGSACVEPHVDVIRPAGPCQVHAWPRCKLRDRAVGSCGCICVLVTHVGNVD